MDIKYGNCSFCGGKLIAEWFVDKEYKNGIQTGRERMAISCLFCEDCFKVYTVDYSFDGKWYR